MRVEQPENTDFDVLCEESNVGLRYRSVGTEVIEGKLFLVRAFIEDESVSSSPKESTEEDDFDFAMAPRVEVWIVWLPRAIANYQFLMQSLSDPAPKRAMQGQDPALDYAIYINLQELTGMQLLKGGGLAMSRVCFIDSKGITHGPLHMRTTAFGNLQAALALVPVTLIPASHGSIAGVGSQQTDAKTFRIIGASNDALRRMSEDVVTSLWPAHFNYEAAIARMEEDAEDGGSAAGGSQPKLSPRLGQTSTYGRAVAKDVATGLDTLMGTFADLTTGLRKRLLEPQLPHDRPGAHYPDALLERSQQVQGMPHSRMLEFVPQEKSELGDGEDFEVMNDENSCAANTDNTAGTVPTTTLTAGNNPSSASATASPRRTTETVREPVTAEEWQSWLCETSGAIQADRVRASWLRRGDNMKRMLNDIKGKEDGSATLETLCCPLLFHHGLADDRARQCLWPYLLGVFQWDSTAVDRTAAMAKARTDYARALGIAQRLLVEAEKQEAEHNGSGSNSINAGGTNRESNESPDNVHDDMVDQRQRIDKDVMRTDRNLPLFAEDGGEGLTAITDVLLAYCGAHGELGYVQGMSDLAAELVQISRADVSGEMPVPLRLLPKDRTLPRADVDDNNIVDENSCGDDDKISQQNASATANDSSEEPLIVAIGDVHDDRDVFAYSMFEGLMARMKGNFHKEMHGMHHQLTQLGSLLKVIDVTLYDYLACEGMSVMFFCFRWLLIHFKRELDFDSTKIMWEAIWSCPYTHSLHLFIASGLLDKERNEILIRQLSLDGILKHINNMANQIEPREALRLATVCVHILAQDQAEKDPQDLPADLQGLITRPPPAMATMA
eukprot:Clim_evm58s136 gene=Clim_evmTU58s136